MAKDIRVVLRLDSSDFNRGISSARNSINTLSSDVTNLAATLGVALGTNEIVRYIATWQDLQNKIRGVYETTDQQIIAFGDIKKIAGETRSSLTDVADLYTKLTLAGDTLKLTQGEISQVTETFTKALKASGAGASQTSAAILQFGQAMASGKLQGDEFRSLMENAPVFMREFAKAVGVPVGELKKLASEGALTSETVLAATLEMADNIDAKFGRTIPTITDGFTQMKNTIMENFGRMEESTGAFGKIFNFVGNNIIAIVKTIGIVMAASFGASAGKMIAGFALGMVELIKVFRTARSVMAGLVAAEALMVGMTGVGLVAIAGASAAAFAAYKGLNALFGESDAAIQSNNDQYDELIKSIKGTSDAHRDSAKEALAAGQARAKAEKDAKAAAREAAAEARRIAREREKDLKSARDQLINIQENIRSSKEQAALDARRLFTSKEEADLQQLILDIEKERRRQLAEVNKLERLTPAERTAQEEEINRLYDDRLKLAKSVAMSGYEGAMAFDVGKEKRSISIAAKVYSDSFIDADSKLYAARQRLANTFNQYDRKILEDQLNLRIQTDQQILEEKFNSLERIANYEANGMQEAADRERALSSLRISNIETIRDASLKSIEDRTNAERSFAEAQMTFAQGWAQAYGQYFENLRVMVTDQASYATRIFNTITDGFTNSIMKFVETGKLSFKDLFKSLMTEIIKMQVNKLFLSIFGKGGPLGSLFAGMFASGGMIPAGRYGIAGEAGPELIRGPANVVSTKDTAAILGSGGSAPAITQVTYNINAVDSMSFKQMLARDPEFLFNATRAGARRVPR